jgi:dTDP-glucose 4,6-dehydratase
MKWRIGERILTTIADKTVLVTGCAGFIGSNLCHILCDDGIRVIGIDNFSKGSNMANLPELPSFFFHYADIRDSCNLREIFESYKPDIVIHLAAESHVDRSIEGDLSFWQTNIVGTSNLLRLSREHNVELFVNQISDEAIGPTPVGTSHENTKFHPTSPYAASKAAQYYVGQSYFETYGFNVISTFPTNTYGPRQWPEKIIPKFTLRLLRGQKVPLMKSVQNERDWLAVSDHCNALIHIARYGSPGNSYNIGADNHCTNRDLTDMLLELTGNSGDMVEIVEDRKAHDFRYAVNWSKIFNLGWRPEENFGEYLKYTVEWYRDHQDNYPKEL